MDTPYDFKLNEIEERILFHQLRNEVSSNLFVLSVIWIDVCNYYFDVFSSYKIACFVMMMVQSYDWQPLCRFSFPSFVLWKCFSIVFLIHKLLKVLGRVESNSSVRNFSLHGFQRKNPTGFIEFF
jgi:hypothetical protein